MATPYVTYRFSQIVKHTVALTGAEIVPLSQNISGTKKVNSATSATLRTYYKTKLDATNVVDLVNFGDGIAGVGSSANPLKLDPSWMNSRYLQSPNNLSISKIGDRNTRYLPISRQKLFLTNAFLGSRNTAEGTYVHPPAINLERTGELKVLQVGDSNTTITISYGRWEVDKNLDSEQIIERAIKPESIEAEYRVVGVFGNTATAAIARVRKKSDNTYHYFYMELNDGSLFEKAFGNAYYIGAETSTIGAKIKNGSAAVATTTKGKFLFVYQPPTTATSPTDIECYYLSTTSGSQAATLVSVSNWTVSSYAGLFSAQANMRVSDKVVGSSAEKCELVSNANFTYTLAALNNSKTRFITLIQDRNNLDNVILYLRGYVGIAHTSTPSVVNKYNYDIGFRLTLTTAKGTAVALGSYVGNKPTITGSVNNIPQFSNKRNTFQDRSAVNSEYLVMLRDGSIVTALNGSGVTAQPMVIRKSIRGINFIDNPDIHQNIASGRYEDPLDMNYSVKYGADISTPFKLYISSPITYMLGNGGRGVIPAQILNLAGYITTASVISIDKQPYADKQFKGLRVNPVHLYIQNTGTTGVLIASTSFIKETANNAYLCSVYFLPDGSGSILAGQAFSRLHVHRPSYSPQGSSIPVSYDHPGQNPKEFWLDDVVTPNSDLGTANVEVIRLSTKIITIKPGYRATFYLNGAGGGGGGSIHNYSSSQYAVSNYGQDGADTGIYLESNPAYFMIAGGGKGGKGANWGNGSSYTNGSAGAGGSTNYNVIGSRMEMMGIYPGNTPTIGSRWVRQPGGATVAPEALYMADGHGGQGAWGVGDEKWSYGGGGGGGASCVCEVANTTSYDITIRVTTGAGGKGWKPTSVTNGNPGDDGADGCCIVIQEKI